MSKRSIRDLVYIGPGSYSQVVLKPEREALQRRADQYQYLLRFLIEKYFPVFWGKNSELILEGVAAWIRDKREDDPFGCPCIIFDSYYFIGVDPEKLILYVGVIGSESESWFHTFSRIIPGNGEPEVAFWNAIRQSIDILDGNASFSGCPERPSWYIGPQGLGHLVTTEHLRGGVAS